MSIAPLRLPPYPPTLTPNPWSSEKIESGDSGEVGSVDRPRKTGAERAFHPGGAGAPAHASWRKDSIFNFFTALPGLISTRQVRTGQRGYMNSPWRGPM